MNRRGFLKASGVIAGGVVLSRTNLIASLIRDAGGNMRVLKGNIGVYTERGGTIGWMISDDAVVVIDSQFRDTANNLLMKIKAKTNRKIDILFNTHHHGDHTTGNYALKDYTNEIIAHEDCVATQKKMYGSGENAEYQVYAGTTFQEKWTGEAGKEKITAYHHVPAHTYGDAAVNFSSSGVVHTGDLVFNNLYPYIDKNGGGANIKGWILTLDKLYQHYDSSLDFIFGHGDTDENVTGKKEALKRMSDYLNRLYDFVDKEIKNGKTKEQIAAAESIPGVKDRKEKWPGAMKANLEAAYLEIAEGV